MKVHDKTAKVDTLKLIVDTNLNVRDQYDLPSMEEQIRKVGRVLEPVWVEKESMRVLKGNRRTWASQNLLKNPDSPKELKDNLAEMNVIFVEGLSEKERLELILDQGSQKSLTRTEIIKAVWRLDGQMLGFMDIALLMYQSLATFTGNTNKALELQNIHSRVDREAYLRKWLKGTLDDYLLVAARLGDKIKRQVLLAEARQERQLTDAEKAEVMFDCTRERVRLLRTAKNEDQKSGKWDAKKESGPAFDEAIKRFQAEDQGSPKQKGKRPTVTDLSDRASSVKSDTIKDLLNMAAGNTREGFNVMDADSSLFRMEMILDELRKWLKDAKESTTKALISAIIYGDHGQVLEQLKKVK
jgi:hypothetical protein